MITNVQSESKIVSKKKLAIIAQPEDVVTPTSSGSISIIIIETAKRLTGLYDITIFSREEPKLASDESDLGIRFIRLDTKWDDSLIYYFNRFKIKISKIFNRSKSEFSSNSYFKSYYYIFYILKIALLSRRDRYDYVLIPNFSQFVPIVRFFNPNIKILFNIQCEWMTQLNYRSAKFRIKYMNLVSGCSRYITEGISQRYPNQKAKCNVIYNGVDLDLFNPGSKKNIFRDRFASKEMDILCYVGRITPEKGIHTLIDVMKIIVKKRPKVVLLIAGAFSFNPPPPKGSRGPEEERFENLKTKYQENLLKSAQSLENNIKFLGLVSRSELPDFYRACDIFIHPAIWNEPLGITLLEAMACGRPVISTPRGGIPEILIDGQNGRIVEPDHPEKLAESILALLDSPETLLKLGNNGRRMVESKFSWDHIAKELDSIIREF